MAYYYVKNGGTKPTGSTTKQTGSFATLGAANYYNSIAEAITGGATSGDIICVSDAHAYTQATNITYSGPTSGDFLYVVSVDDTACDTEKAAVSAQEHMTDPSSAYVAFSGRLSLHSMYFESSDALRVLGSAQVVASGCTFENTNNGDINITAYGDGSYFNGIDCSFVAPATGLGLRTQAGGVIVLQGGALTGMSAVFDAGHTGGGGSAYLYGTDVSPASYILNNVGSNAAEDDLININLFGCKVNASLTAYVDETLENLFHRVSLTNSAATSAEAEYQFYVESYGGAVEDDTSYYRNASTAFPSGKKISLKCAATADATPAAPFWFDFPTRYADLSDTGVSDTITIYLQSNTQLYDSDVWAEVLYPDGTNQHEYNYLSSRHDNILDTNGTELTTNTEAWNTNLTYRYQIDLDTNTHDPGSDGYPIIRVYVASGSADIYFDSEVVLS